MDKENIDQNKIKELEEKIKELEENWKRALADYINLEKRTAEEKFQSINYAKENMVRNFLPVLDHLEMLLQHTEDQGTGLIVTEIRQILGGYGVKEIEATEKDFDHNFMEAIEMVSGEKNKVVEVTLKGYVLEDKLLRPAQVKVGLGEDSVNSNLIKEE